MGCQNDPVAQGHIHIGPALRSVQYRILDGYCNGHYVETNNTVCECHCSGSSYGTGSPESHFQQIVYRFRGWATTCDQSRPPGLGAHGRAK
jgi:hypothetical protein